MTQQINQTYPAFAFGGVDFVGTGTPFPTGQWHYIAVTFDTAANRIKLFANGSLNSSQSTATNITESAGSLLIASEDGGVPLNGKLDEIRISSTVRSEDWVATEYNNQNPTSTFFII